MSAAADAMKRAIREMLGARPSEALYARIDKLIDEADTGAAALGQGAQRVRGLVQLFIDRSKAELVEQRLRDVLKL